MGNTNTCLIDVERSNIRRGPKYLVTKLYLPPNTQYLIFFKDMLEAEVPEAEKDILRIFSIIAEAVEEGKCYCGTFQVSSMPYATAKRFMLNNAYVKHYMKMDNTGNATLFRLPNPVKIIRSKRTCKTLKSGEINGCLDFTDVQYIMIECRPVSP